MKLNYRPDIDGLRAVAVLAVVLFHAFPEVFPGGFIGVDIFFVISGYLITSIIRAEMDAHSWSLRDFYARRVLRIFPALALVLWSCFFLGWFTLLADEYKLLGKHISSGGAFVANFAYWFESGYFDKASELKPLLHLWSLGIEEQFYIFWPLVLWFLLCRASHQSLKLVLVGLFAGSLLISIYAVAIDRAMAFYSPVSRAWELLAGATLALAGSMRLTQYGWIHSPQIRRVSLGLLIVLIFIMTPGSPFPGALAVLPVVATAILIFTADSTRASNTDGVGQFLSSRWMVAVGLISYPLYMWHWPLLSFARIFAAQEPPVWIRFVLVIAAFVLAAITFLVVERPLRKLNRKWVVVILCALIALVSALGLNVYKRDGLERVRHKKMIRLEGPAAQDFVDFEITGAITDANCSDPFKFPEKEVCLITQPGSTITNVIVGDSHAVHAFWGVSAAVSKQGGNLQVRGRGACVPLVGVGNGEPPYRCQPAMDALLNNIATDPNIKRVFISFRGRYLPNDAGPELVEVFRAGLDATLKLFEQNGKQVFFFLPVVELGFDPKLCLGNLPLGRKNPHSCDILETTDRALARVWLEVVDEVTRVHPRVKVVDPASAFCVNQVCRVIQNGRSFLKDDNHLSQYGSRLLGEHLKLD